MIQVIRCAPRTKTEKKMVRNVYFRISGIACARAEEEVARLGLSELDIVEPQLFNVYQGAIQWGLYPELVRWVSRMHKKCPGEGRLFNSRSVIGFFEKHSKQVDFHLKDVTFRLEHFLVEMG